MGAPTSQPVMSAPTWGCVIPIDPLTPCCLKQENRFGQVCIGSLTLQVCTLKRGTLHQTKRIMAPPPHLLPACGREERITMDCHLPTILSGHWRATAGQGSDPVSTWLANWKQLLSGPLGSFRRTVKNSGLGQVKAGRRDWLGKKVRGKCRPCGLVDSVPKKPLSRGLRQPTPNMGRRSRKLKKDTTTK